MKLKQDPRKERREHFSAVESLLSCEIIFEKERAPVTIVDFHYNGASLILRRETFNLLKSSQDYIPRIQFLLGKNQYSKEIYFRITWVEESILRIGLQFLFDLRDTDHRSAERVAINDRYAPLLVCKDPYNPTRSLALKVTNISQAGIAVETSLSNKHLLPGLIIHSADLMIPPGFQVHLNLKIENARRTEGDGSYQLGLSVLSSIGEFQKASSAYLTIFYPAKDQEDRLSKLSEAKLLSKNIASGLAFRIVSSDEEYQEVLNLRLQGYTLAKKTASTTTLADMGPGLDQETNLVAAFLGNQLVGSVNLNFISDPKQSRYLQNVETKHTILEKLDNFLEINRLVIHPKIQRSDVIIGLFQKVQAIALANKTYEALIVCDSKLINLYEKIGFKDSGVSIPHTIIPDMQLNLMVMNRNVFLHSEGFDADRWEKIYGAIHAHFVQLGIFEENSANPELPSA